MSTLRLPQSTDYGGGLVNILGSQLPCWVKFFVRLIFYGPNQNGFKTIGTWVRWNSESFPFLRIPVHKPQKGGPLKMVEPFPQEVCCSPCVRANVVIIKIIDKIVIP